MTLYDGAKTVNYGEVMVFARGLEMVLQVDPPVDVAGQSGASWLFRGNTTNPDVYCAYNDGVNGAPASEACMFGCRMLHFPCVGNMLQFVSFPEGQSHVAFSATFFFRADAIAF